MTLYKFKTFTTSYYFPKITKETQFLFGVYSAFGGKLSKIYWFLFRKCTLFRSLHVVKSTNIDFPYQQICDLEGNGSLMSFNLGSPGVERKISILGYNPTDKKPFFAKFSQLKGAMELSKNEIEILSSLQNTGLVPELYDTVITEDYVFFKTECIHGGRFHTINLTEDLFVLLIKLSSFHLNKNNETIDGLKKCLSHGDFCPWNILKQEHKLQLIDWETASDRPLGFDLFTYIFQTTFLLRPDLSIKKILSDNLEYIKRYFDAMGQQDFKPYLKYFANYKLVKESEKKNAFLSKRYHKLANHKKLK